MGAGDWLKQNIGGIAGGALGFVVGGGPQGAMMGYGIGNSISDQIGLSGQQAPDFAGGMAPHMKNINRVGSQLEDRSDLLLNQGKSMMDYWGSQNIMQRNALKTAAGDATQVGAMNQQRLAAQQGSGGPMGLLSQATQNQAYKNMMGAANMGNTAYQKSFGLGQSFLKDSASVLGSAGDAYGQGGKWQSEIDVNQANWNREKQEDRNDFMGNLAGSGLNWYMQSKGMKGTN